MFRKIISYDMQIMLLFVKDDICPFFCIFFSYRDALVLSTRVQLVILSYRTATQPRSVPVQLIVAGRAPHCLRVWWVFAPAYYLGLLRTLNHPCGTLLGPSFNFDSE